VRGVPAVNEFLTYLVPGIADGSIYALCAVGLVLTYKTSGVFNFAHGAVAAGAAYVFYDLRIVHGVPWPIAALLALFTVGVVGGLVLERLANLMSTAPTVSVVVATVGVLVAIQSLCTAIFGGASIQFPEYLPQGGFQLGQVTVTASDIIITTLSLGSAFGLFYFFGSTRMGKAMTAVVDDPNLLSLQATNPAAVRRFAWVLGSSFASVSGMLLAPQVGISVNVLILLVIAAYGAAAVGFFDNLPLTVAGALVIGILVDYVPSFTDDSKYQTVRALPRNLPFLVLFAVLVFAPSRKLTQRGVRNARRFRPIRTFSRPVTGGLLMAGGTFLALLPNILSLFNSEARLSQYAAGLGYVIIFASLGLITWTSGQISLCHLGFAAIGATTTGHLLNNGVPFVLALVLGAAVTIPAGAIVAVPAIRLSGIYVAVATFGFGIVLQQIIYPSPLMFTVNNLVQVPRPHILGIDFTGDKAYYYLALMITVVCCALILVVRTSRLGQLLRALSDSPAALDAHGANTNLTRVLVFVISAFLAGIGGGVLAGVTESASGAAGGTFDSTVSLVFVAVLGFCGRRPLAGPFLAAFLYQVIKIYPFFNTPTAIKYQGVAFGLLAIIVAVGPGITAGRLGSGKRASERDGGNSPVDERSTTSARPASVIQPARRPRVGALTGSVKTSPAVPANSSARSKVPVGAESGGTS
jgi:branched-subunit amino acid ABC-type transport system permease component